MKNKNLKKVKVFAPATVANVGPGFDILGVAVKDIGDIVEARKTSRPGIRITQIIGEKNLPFSFKKNTAGIAAYEVFKIIKPSGGVELRLFKNVPVASGMGSSAASAVAGAVAVNMLFGSPLKKEELIIPALRAEAKVSGEHADNIAPCLFGGFVLIKSYRPLKIIPLNSKIKGHLVIFFPLNSKLKGAKTKFARLILPKFVPLKKMVLNSGNLGGLIAGVCQNNFEIFAQSICDVIVEPKRSYLIPKFSELKKAALENGALAFSISGAGPSVFALTKDKKSALRVERAMREVFEKSKLDAKTFITSFSSKGARKIN